jgi:hypothetical protein
LKKGNNSLAASIPTLPGGSLKGGGKGNREQLPSRTSKKPKGYYEIISNGITLYQRFDNTMLGSFLAACAGTYTFKGESYTSAQEAIAAHKVFINV